MLIKRTNILFRLDMWERLTALAKEKKQSVGELIRTAVEKIYFHTDPHDEVRRACQEIERIRVRQKGRVDYKALINEGRKY